MTEPTPTERPELAPLHPDAVGFTLFRILPSGAGRAYSSVEFVHGWRGANHMLRILAFCGYVKDSSNAPDGCHVLDVLNSEGDIIQDYAVPAAPSHAFSYIKKKLGLAVASEDAADYQAGDPR